MTAYLDSGVVTKWYVPEVDSAAALALRRKFRPPLVLTHLHRVELLNAWHLKVFRGEIPPDVASQAAEDLQGDINAGLWIHAHYDLPSVFGLAERLTRQHSATLGTRTLDILHVAAARELGCKHFVTGDERQARLAAAVALKVTRL